MRIIQIFAAAIAVCASFAPPSAVSAQFDPKTPKPLDGVLVEAVEDYINPKTSSFFLGVGIYPFDAYYNDISINAGYNYRINQTWSWDIINAGYFIPFERNLTSQLADKYSVNPVSIEKLQYIITSDVVFTHTYGKFLFLEDYIRYFRASVFFGGGLVNTTQQSEAAGNFGARFEFFHADSFAWIIDVRDALTIKDDGYVTFTFGSGFSF
jgi:outer membrane beta-barrel protein